jgi:hypothetical protein
MRRRIAAVLMLILAGCAQFPVTDEVKLEFSDDGQTALVTVDTRFQLKSANEETTRRIDAARAAALQGTDPWSLRFSRLTPRSETFTSQKTRGALERVSRSVQIDTNDLQHVFGDTNVTVSVVGGDGWRELRFYPGASNRATREQQRHFASELSSWSGIVAQYFAAVHRMYTYMDERPGRAQYLFAVVMSENREDGSPPMVTEEEQPYVDDVVHAIEAIGDRMNEQESRAESFAEEADLVYNPFPARVTVVVPGEVLAVEGFPAAQDHSLVIEPVSLFQAIASLEGKWISPDPLAAMMREQPMTSQQLAEKPRRSVAFVSAASVAEAIREQLARPRAYSVRWRE